MPAKGVHIIRAKLLQFLDLKYGLFWGRFLDKTAIWGWVEVFSNMAQITILIDNPYKVGPKNLPVISGVIIEPPQMAVFCI